MIVLFNKPFNVLCQFTDKEGRKTLSDFISIKNIYPAGRLDFDSEGLVVLTDEGKLQHLISDPENKMIKTYLVQVEGIPKEEDLNYLRRGIRLKDAITKPAKAEISDEPVIWRREKPIRERKNIPTSWIKISIAEGKNRQVRRMTAAIGFPALRLIRISVGSWNIGKLKPGEWKIVSSA
ncbi:MAG: pseudouridine synthase [Ignavibacteriaceae bacterium]|nr:pseudouridine synthase [Ignavibacteriaceae bacterium]